MAQHTVRELSTTLQLFAVVDPAAIESQEFVNKSGGKLQLTFVKDQVLTSGREVVVADNAVPIPEIAIGETYTVTAQMIQDALAAGDHTDIYLISEERQTDSTTSGYKINTI
jgi:hypothetical protein